jgi:chemotaxis methyl-accepting protein methylase
MFSRILKLDFIPSSADAGLLVLRVCLCNVMLYFSQETRRTLLAGIHRLLAPDGVLFRGSSEQPADPALWTSVLAGGTCHFTPKCAR